jgi:hypothetical protein
MRPRDPEVALPAPGAPQPKRSGTLALAAAGGLFALWPLACQTILGDDFEIDPNATTTDTQSNTTSTTDTTSTTSTTTTTSTLLANGEACTSGEECTSNLCVDAVCCDDACAGGCMACNVASSLGSCSPEPGGTNPANECGAGVCDGAGACATGALDWSKTFGGDGNQAGRAVAVDGAGNVVMVGRYDGSVDFGQGGPLTTNWWDLFVAKFSADGTPLWRKGFGDSSALTENVQAVALDEAGNIVIAGAFDGSVNFNGTALPSSGGIGKYDFFLAKLDSNGGYLWSKRFESISNSVLLAVAALAVDSDNNVFLGGSVLGPVDFGGGTLAAQGDWDVFLASFDASGVYRWSKRFGGAQTDGGSAVATDPQGNVLLTGAFSANINFGQGPLQSGGGWDAFVAKFDNDGNTLWADTWGDNLLQMGTSVAADPAGNVMVGGSNQGTVNFGGGPHSAPNTAEPFVVKLTAAGDYVWDKFAGNSVTDGWVTSMACLPNGSISAAGFIRGSADFGGGLLTSVGNADAFALKLSPDGAHVWSQLYGSTGVNGTNTDDAVQGLALDPTSGSVLLTGYWGPGDINFGGSTHSTASRDIFLVKLHR